MVINAIVPSLQKPLLSNAPGSPFRLKESVVSAEQLRRGTYAHTDDDETARNMMQKRCAESAITSMTPERVLAAAYSQTPEGSMSIMWEARWADQGFPVVRVAARLAASFMATGFHPSAVSTIVAPWRALVIVPPPLLTFVGGDGKSETVIEVRVLTTTDAKFKDYPENPFAWFVCAVGERGTILHMIRAAHALFSPPDNTASWYGHSDHAMNLEVNPGDDRTLEMVTRLVGGVFLEMSDPAMLEAAKRGKAHGRSVRTGDPPEPRIYELSRSVKLDVRDEVRAYVEGRRSTSPSVQVLVAGHWKRQRCGPNGSERKLIQIEPYWRGPDLSPVLAKVD